MRIWLLGGLTSGKEQRTTLGIRLRGMNNLIVDGGKLLSWCGRDEYTL